MTNKSKARGATKQTRLQSTAEPAAPDQPSTGRARQQVAASRRQQRATAAIAQRRRKQVLRWGGAATALALLVLVVVLYQRSTETDAPPASAGIPGPRGGRDVAVDVNTLVGQPAPSFTLTDSEGTSSTVTPGQGRPVVLISHMGIT